VIVYNDKQWDNFFTATGRDDLRSNPKFATFAGRATNIDTVYAELARILEAKTTAEWTDILNKADVPVMPMHDLESLLRDPHVVATEFLSGDRSSDRRTHPQHEGLRALVGDRCGDGAAGAAPERAQRGSFAGSRLLDRREIAALVRDGVTRAAPGTT